MVHALARWLTDSIQIPIKWKSLPVDFDWIRAGQTESFTKTYFATHPELIAKYLGKGVKLVGLEAVIPASKRGRGRRQRVDFVYRKGEHFFVVECKESWTKIGDAVEEATGYAKALGRHMISTGVKPMRITPVGVAVDYTGSGGPFKQGVILRAKDWSKPSSTRAK